MARRSRLDPEERRAQLIALGVAALADRSLDELTTEYVARQAGVARGLFAYYFGSRQGFHREVVGTAGGALLRATEPKPELAPMPRLRDTLRRVVDFALEHEGTFVSLLRGAASGDAEVRAVIEEVRRAQTDRVVAVVLELGAPDSDILRLSLRSWVAFDEQLLIDGVVAHRVSPDEAVDLMVRSLFAVVAAVEPEMAVILSGHID